LRFRDTSQVLRRVSTLFYGRGGWTVDDVVLSCDGFDEGLGVQRAASAPTIARTDCDRESNGTVL